MMIRAEGDLVLGVINGVMLSVIVWIIIGMVVMK